MSKRIASTVRLFCDDNGRMQSHQRILGVGGLGLGVGVRDGNGVPATEGKDGWLAKRWCWKTKTEWAILIRFFGVLG
jgi:hypothetical protein